MKYFASDNNAGMHAQVMHTLIAANEKCYSSYGNDHWTEKAQGLIKAEFGSQAKVYFVTSGTGANVMALKCLLRCFEGVIAAESSHLHTDECGSLEAITGCKLLAVPSPHGKLTVTSLERLFQMRSTVHSVYPKVVSIAQLTEVSTLYSHEELTSIGDLCRQNNCFFHMDGARLVNAAVRAGVSLRAMSTDVGVDVLSLGGTKNGLMGAEAVIFLNPDLGSEFEYIQKQSMQLLSKMRFLSAQFVAYFTDQLWEKNALNANNMTDLLVSLLKNLDHVRIAYTVDGNAIFARMPKASIDRLLKEFYFYVIDPFDAPGYPKGWQLVRFMTSFASTEEEVREFARAVHESA